MNRTLNHVLSLSLSLQEQNQKQKLLELKVQTVPMSTGAIKLISSTARKIGAFPLYKYAVVQACSKDKHTNNNRE
jgi:hypothetical protein